MDDNLFEAPGLTRRPDGLYDLVLVADYGSLKAGETLQGIDRFRVQWILNNLKAAEKEEKPEKTEVKPISPALAKKTERTP